MDNFTTVASMLQHGMPQVTFSWFDYVLFTAILGLSVLIGIYFGFYKKQDTTDDYLLGGKSMTVFPVGLSLIASHISGITILSVPADVYIYGSNYVWIGVATIIISFFTSFVYLPVFFKLQRTSVFEYLDIRFDKRIRILASFMYTLSIFLYNPIVIYIPALAFSQATGVNVHFVTPVVSIICIFYTTIGGLRAVIWTDALQFFGIIGSIVVIMFVGAEASGGFGVVWEKASQGQRLDLFDFRLDPTLRDSFWAMMIGGTVHWTVAIAINQGSVQKYLAVPTIGDAKKVLAMYSFGMLAIISVSVFTGNIIYAKYSDCDLLSTKQVTRNDQLLPYFVMDVAGHIPGLPAVFIAGVFSAALSSLSATLNTISATIYKDFISPFMPATTTEKQASDILKIIVVVSGIICTASVFVIEHMGGMLAFSVTFQAIIGGPLLGLFTLGLLFPQANYKGALYGALTSIFCVSWLVFGNQWYKSQGLIKDYPKPVSTAGCNFYFNSTLSSLEKQQADEPFVLYRISFWYNSLIGAIIVIAVGSIVSWITKADSPPVYPDLISPVVYFFLRKQRSDKVPPSTSDYLNVEKALQLAEYNSEKEGEVCLSHLKNNNL